MEVHFNIMSAKISEHLKPAERAFDDARSIVWNSEAPAEEGALLLIAAQLDRINETLERLCEILYDPTKG